MQLGADLESSEGRRRVRREVRVAGAGCEDDDPALLDVSDSATSDVGLGHGLHLDGGHHAGEDAFALESVLQSERVHDRGKHADVVALGAVHALRRCSQTSEDVAAANHDGDLGTAVHYRFELLGEGLEDLGIDAVAGIPHERFTGELEQDAFVVETSPQISPRVQAFVGSPALLDRIQQKDRPLVRPALPVVGLSSRRYSAADEVSSPRTIRVEADDCDLAPGFLGDVVEIRADGDVGVLDEELLDKDDLLEELLESTLSDLLLDLLRLARLGCLSLVDIHLVVDQGRVDRVTVDRDRHGCGDLHRDVLREPGQTLGMQQRLRLTP